MIGRRAIIGVVLLAAIALNAISASSAMAVVKYTTAVTCLEVKPTESTVGFKDEHCTEGTTGTSAKWIHKSIPSEKATSLKVTNNETMSKTVTARLKSKLEGKAFEIEAGGFQSCNNEKEKTQITNWPEDEKLKLPPEASGPYCGEYTNVLVKEPAKCEVAKKVVVLNAGSFGTRVEAPGGGEEEMWVQFGSGEKPLATFEFTGAECALNKKIVEVKGFPRANVQTEGETKLLGATLKFTTKETGNQLKVGAEKAEFEGTFTPRMTPEVGVPESPIALTTAEPI
jgi:hypothetical protein